MVCLAYARTAALLGAVVSAAGGCDGGVEYVPAPDLSGLSWTDPSADGPRNPDFGPLACATNADCLGSGGGPLCCSGACVNPASDVKNCGACGSVCPAVPNGLPGCVQGTCIVAEHNGFEDCNGSPIDGSETDIQHDPSNCGACGHVCPVPPGALPTCLQGKCSVLCAPGYADCDGNVQNGCETDTTLDVKSCGGCGKVCTAPLKATAACDLGRCAFRCQLGYGDCDSNPATGCETDVTVDPSNCGHCGNACPPNTKCVSSRCR